MRKEYKEYMGKWYRKTLTKAAVLLAGVLGGAAFITSLGLAETYAGTVSPARVMRIVNEPYEDSADFNTSVENIVSDVFDMFRLRETFEADGAYDPDKTVDVMEFADSGRASGENASGMAYTLDDLIKWGENFSAEDEGAYSENVVVCQREDGMYYYYYLNEFLELVEKGDLVIEFDDPYQTQAAFLSSLSGGDPIGSDNGLTIYDAKGKAVYTDCWNFGAALREIYSPVGADNILQVVNSTPELNGKLSVVYDNITFALTSLYNDYSTYESGWKYMEEGNTNFTYLYVDRTKKKLYTNKGEYSDYKDSAKYIKEMKEVDHARYIVVYPKLKDFETNMNLSASGEWDMVRSYESNRDSENVLAVSIDTLYPIQDQFYEGSINYNQNIPFLRWALVFLLAGGILFLISAVWLAVTAGKKPESEELVLTVFDHWKTEISVLIVTGVWLLGTYITLGVGTAFSNWSDVVSAVEYYAEESSAAVYTALFTTAISLSDITGVFLYGVFTFLCFYAGYVSLMRRIKAKLLWKGSILFALITAVGQAWQERAVTVKAGIVVLVFLATQWSAILTQAVPAVILALAADVAVVWFVLNGAMAKSRIRRGIEEIAGGNREYRIDLKWLRGTELDIAGKINNIGNGLNKAVEEAMRNERLKTDLITNVSHDIKTPLTSIINYVDILKRSNINDERIRGYLDILEAKAQRLKTLTEDVVEASKVSSGNIVLECMDMDLRELVQQTEGELAEKFAARNLTMVLNIPEDPAVIHVDGRRMWRVLENVFGNAAKYAMPGTRIYADITMTADKVKFSLKNVSEQQLNISADELTERFIRGDISRSTEGSGLGLSIAKSLTTMQGGEFELYLDGDLFRVNIVFARVAPKQIPVPAGE